MQRQLRNKETGDDDIGYTRWNGRGRTDESSIDGRKQGGRHPDGKWSKRSCSKKFMRIDGTLFPQQENIPRLYVNCQVSVTLLTFQRLFSSVGLVSFFTGLRQCGTTTGMLPAFITHPSLIAPIAYRLYEQFMSHISIWMRLNFLGCRAYLTCSRLRQLTHYNILNIICLFIIQ